MNLGIQKSIEQASYTPSIKVAQVSPTTESKDAVESKPQVIEKKSTANVTPGLTNKISTEPTTPSTTFPDKDEKLTNTGGIGGAVKGSVQIAPDGSSKYKVGGGVSYKNPSDTTRAEVSVGVAGTSKDGATTTIKGSASSGANKQAREDAERAAENANNF